MTSKSLASYERQASHSYHMKTSLGGVVLGCAGGLGSGVVVRPRNAKRTEVRRSDGNPVRVRGMGR